MWRTRIWCNLLNNQLLFPRIAQMVESYGLVNDRLIMGMHKMRNVFQVWVPWRVSLQISWRPIRILIVKMFAQKYFMLNIFLTFFYSNKHLQHECYKRSIWNNRMIVLPLPSWAPFTNPFPPFFPLGDNQYSHILIDCQFFDMEFACGCPPNCFTQN